MAERLLGQLESGSTICQIAESRKYKIKHIKALYISNTFLKVIVTLGVMGLYTCDIQDRQLALHRD